MINKAKTSLANLAKKIRNSFTTEQAVIMAKIHATADGTVAEAYVDTGVKILIAVVIGALLLAGLYSLFGSTIMPTVVKRVQELFNYKGE